VEHDRLRHGALRRTRGVQQYAQHPGHHQRKRLATTGWPFPAANPPITDNPRHLSRLADRIESYRGYLDITATPGKPGWKAYGQYPYPEIKACKTRFQHEQTGAKRLCWFALTERGGWKNPAKMGLTAPPYRAATLKGAKEIWLLNGEKAVDRAVTEWKVTATCLPNGEGNWRGDYLPWFRDADTVYLVIDNDPTGAHHGEVVGSELTKAGVTVRLVRLPNLPPKGDLYDFIEAGNSEATCREVAEGAPLATAEIPV
jgi:hypothetical protein